jgi:hypothetical protein
MYAVTKYLKNKGGGGDGGWMFLIRCIIYLFFNNVGQYLSNIKKKGLSYGDFKQPSTLQPSTFFFFIKKK